MSPEELDKLIEKYLEGKCTDEECDYINSWYLSLGKDRGQPLNRISDQIASTENRMLNRLQSHALQGSTGTKRRSLSWHYAAIAASVLICVAAGYYVLKPEVRPAPLVEQVMKAEFSVVENTSSPEKKVILPDGTIVRMSPESKIRYTNDINTPSREVFLTGEAYFDVAHNPERPFYVYAGNVVTRVMGTSFIVRARGQEKVTVSVKTGKVTVYSRKASHKKTVLTQNQKAVYDQVTDLVATEGVSAEQVIEDKRNLAEMHFEETPVSEVLEMLIKTYDIDIIYHEASLSGCVLTSSFFEEGLYDRIDVICTAIGATYKIVDAQVVIESKGCNLKTD
ncbi:MAG TPA: FecR domain-containing protein [Chryseosolibacter sp.]